MAFKESLPQNFDVRHVPCVVLVDTSGSMEGRSINEVNEGLQTLRSEILSDEKASLAVEICVISFNSNVDIIQPFVPITEFKPPRLTAGGLTSMNQAILAGLEEIQNRKQVYRGTGVSFYRPWMFLLTDGAPTDDECKSEAMARLNQYADDGKVCFFAVGVTGADLRTLSKYKCHNGAALSVAEGVRYRDLFQWLSSSMRVVSSSRADSSVSLPPLPEGVGVITIQN